MLAFTLTGLVVLCDLGESCVVAGIATKLNWPKEFWKTCPCASNYYIMPGGVFFSVFYAAVSQYKDCSIDSCMFLMNW